MFEELIRELRQYEHGKSVSIPLPTDDDGYLDRQCPEEGCRAEFKILEDDWRNKVADEKAFCPFCRHARSSDEWATEAQIAYAKKAAVAQFQRSIHRALDNSARRFNQRQKPGFITLSLSVKPDRSPVRLPRVIGEAMEQRFSCEVCNCRYTSIGAAYFCPACGHNSVLLTFEQTISQVRDTIRLLSTLREALAPDRDAAENAARLILEQSLTKLVGGFERFTEALFARTASAPSMKIKRGCFQRLDEASSIWHQVIGQGYDTMLDSTEFSELRRLFQRRHLIAHRDGIVDSDYIQKSADQDLAVGQRIQVREAEVLRLVNLLKKLFASLSAAVPLAGEDTTT